MALGKVFGSLFRSRPKPEAGWAFTVQAHVDLKRQIVYVHVADQVRAEAIASEAVAGLIVARAPVTESVLAKLGVQPGQHSLQTGNGWSFSIQGPAGANNPLVFVFLSNEAEAEAVALKLMPGTILSRSEVPPAVLIRDLGLQPGDSKIL